MNTNFKTAMPTAKVTTGVLGGALVTIMVAMADRFGYSITPAETGALTTLVSFVLAYLKSEN